MSAISEFAKVVKTHQDKMAKAVDGIVEDVKGLNAKIELLQSTPGPISDEDQATLDSLQADAAAMAERLDALDALTPPVPPTA